MLEMLGEIALKINLSGVNMKYLLFATLLFTFSCSSNSDNFYLVNGKFHLFKVYTPLNWVNNIEIAHKNGIATFFHPDNLLNDQDAISNVYIYANGFDFNSPSANFDAFVNTEISNIKKLSKDVIVEKANYIIANTKHIKNIRSYSFINIPNRYRDECVYIESDKSVIAVIYSTKTKNAYNDNIKVFINFINSFSFLSSNPAEISELIRKDKSERPNTVYSKVPKQ